MVLTNVELWAANGSTGSSMPLDFETNNPHVRHTTNLFDPRVVPQMNSNLNHLSSNGYYGFSYVNAAHNIEVNNNNNISNININNNNNNTTTCNLMSNDVNGGMNNATAALQQTYALSANIGGTAYAAGHALNVARCKKRFFVMNDNDDVISDCTDTKNKSCYGSEVSAKRCRFDDDFSAQYFNDFFQLPSTQIATQSCLMDTEEGMQPQQLQYQQQQVDVAMHEGNNNNVEKYEQKLSPQLSTLSAQQHEQHSQQTQQLLPHQQQQQHQQQQEPQQQQQQQLYHQQQHYQDIICHYSHNSNNSSDILPLNNHTSKIELQKNTENILEIRTPNRNK